MSLSARMAAILLTLLSTSLVAADLVIGPPAELTTRTESRVHEGSNEDIASNAEGFMSLWSSAYGQLMVTRFAPDGSRLDVDGQPLLNSAGLIAGAAIAPANDGFHVAAAGYQNRTFGIYGFHVSGSGESTTPQLLVTPEYASALTLTGNGTSYLLTWITQSLYTQTLFGAMLTADFKLAKGPFTIASRELPRTAITHSLDSSAATDGRGFLVTWERTDSPSDLVVIPVSSSGEVGPAVATAVETALQPVIAADASGFVTAWHDGSTIYAGRISPTGVLVGSRSIVVSQNRPITQIAIAAGGGTSVIAYAATEPESCNYGTAVTSVNTVRLDVGLASVGARELERSGSNTALALAGSNDRFLATWSNQSCSAVGQVFAATDAAEPGAVTPISDFLTLAGQNDPAVAWSGERAVVVWSEQRVGDSTPQIYALAVDVEGQGVAITSGAVSHAKPRLAWDGHRFLAVWWQDDGGGTIAGRFLSADGGADGDPFVIGKGTRATLDVAWSGTEHVVAWTSAGSIYSARITPMGAVSSAGVAGDYEATGSVMLAAGAGDVVAIFAATTSAAWNVESALVQESIHVIGTVTTATRACAGFPKACLYGADPIAVAWNGHDFLAITKIDNHPAYGYAVYATPVSIDGSPSLSRRRVGPAGGPVLGATAGEGTLVAAGPDYYLAIPPLHGTTFWNAWLRADGTPVFPEGVYVAEGVNGRPVAVLIAPRRILLVTSMGRIVVRTVDLPPLEHRTRAVRMR